MMGVPTQIVAVWMVVLAANGKDKPGAGVIFAVSVILMVCGFAMATIERKKPK